MAERGEPLSDRELDVLQRLAAGESNKAIADGLSISPHTVKTHLRNIFIKLDVSTRTEAMTVAIQQGVLDVAGADGPQVVDVQPFAASEQDTDDEWPVQREIPRPAAPETSVNGQAEPDAAPVVSHRWRNLSLALLFLLALTAGIFAYVQWRGDTILPVTSEPYQEQALGESRWLSSRPLPEPRAGRAAAAVGLEVYVIGGETGSGVTGDTRVFNTLDRTWRRAAAKPTPVADVTAADLFGEIYVPGGLLAGGRPTAIVEAYSPSQNAWRRAASLPRPVAGAVTVADGGFLYVIGGRDENGPLATAFVYDPAADNWRPIAPLPEPRAGAAGGALLGRLYVVGGVDESGETDTCAVYDPASDAWDECPPMLQPRAGAGATVLLNKLYVIGSTAANPGEPGYGEVYDPNSRAWTVLNLPPDVAAWTEPGVTHVETRIYALGGRMGSALSDGTLVYSPLVFQTFIPAAPSGGDE
jgi:DNA-binding CsgD family transcriptional regulator